MKQPTVKYDEEFFSLIYTMRYGHPKVRKTQSPILRLMTISKCVGIPMTTLRRLLKLRQGNNKRTPTVKQGRPPKINKHNIAYLTSPETLTSLAGMSLAERAKHFHRRYPEKRISTSHL